MKERGGRVEHAVEPSWLDFPAHREPWTFSLLILRPAVGGVKEVKEEMIALFRFPGSEKRPRL